MPRQKTNFKNETMSPQHQPLELGIATADKYSLRYTYAGWSRCKPPASFSRSA